jgi:hypothetical protein
MQCQTSVDSMRKRSFAILTGVVLGTSWLLTGGCVGFESTYRFVEPYNHNHRPFIGVTIDSNFRTSGVPFLFTYSDDVPPYDAAFSYHTEDIVEGAELKIDKIAIRFGDGTAIDLTDHVERLIVPKLDHARYVDNHVLVKRPALPAKWTIHNCIAQRGRFTLLISGSLRKSGRVLEPFQTSLSCNPFSETHFYSTWYWWLVSQA